MGNNQIISCFIAIFSLYSILYGVNGASKLRNEGDHKSAFDKSRKEGWPKKWRHFVLYKAYVRTEQLSCRNSFSSCIENLIYWHVFCSVVRVNFSSFLSNPPPPPTKKEKKVFGALLANWGLRLLGLSLLALFFNEFLNRKRKEKMKKDSCRNSKEWP